MVRALKFGAHNASFKGKKQKAKHKIKQKTDLCILVCVYSISGQHIDFFDFQTNRSLQCMKTELRLHRKSCFHVDLEVLLMKLLAYRMYLPIEECIQFYGFETFNGRGMTVHSK